MAERVCICGHNDLLHQAQAERDEARAENEQCAKDYREECDKRDAAEAERDEALLEAARWEGSFKGMVAVERELKASLAKAVAGLRAVDVAGAEVGSVSPPEAWQVWRYALTKARSILAEIEGDGK